ncbi:hypothetical protein ACF0H5_016897 [Mactra antiquata]
MFTESPVMPSQSVNIKDYNVWISIEKDTKDGMGGIVSGYCSCTAGMLGCYNHIAGVPFRIKKFVKRGEIKTCTDQLSKWIIPKGKTRVKTCKVRDLIWKKGHYTTLFTLKNVLFLTI